MFLMCGLHTPFILTFLTIKSEIYEGRQRSRLTGRSKPLHISQPHRRRYYHDDQGDSTESFHHPPAGFTSELRLQGFCLISCLCGPTRYEVPHISEV